MECKIKSLKIKWIKQLVDEDYKIPWKNYVESKIKSCAKDIVNCNMNENDQQSFKDLFYNEFFKHGPIYILVPHKTLNKCVGNTFGITPILKLQTKLWTLRYPERYFRVTRKVVILLLITIL